MWQFAASLFVASTTFSTFVTDCFSFVFAGLELTWRLAAGSVSPPPPGSVGLPESRAMFPGGPPSLSGGGGAGSRGSSPAGRGGGGDSPGLPPPSPDTLRLPPEELPYVVGVSATHPHPCALCEKSFMKLSHLHHHQQVCTRESRMTLNLSFVRDSKTMKLHKPTEKRDNEIHSRFDPIPEGMSMASFLTYFFL